MSIPIITATQMAKVDDLAIENGLLVMQMMEYAGINIARFVQTYNPKHILIVCGKGHNGGDGIAAARHLHNWGYDVQTVIAENPELLKKTSRHHYDLLKNTGIPIVEWNDKLVNETDIIIDALLGYNINGNPRPPYDQIINTLNSSQKPIIAIDLPSGLNGNDGTAYTPCIKAHSTLTLALPKTGLVQETAQKYVGEIYVADLGIPKAIYEQAGITIDEELFRKKSIINITEI